MLNGQPIAINETQYNILVSHQGMERYTEFYRQMSEMGPDMATLYAAGPTGFGAFGRYSHEYTIDVIGEAEFLAIQRDISEAISDATLRAITDSDDRSGTYYIPSPQQFVEIEIQAWPTVTLSDGVTPLPLESYAGWDFLDCADIFGNDSVGNFGNSPFGAFGVLSVAVHASGLSWHTYNTDYGSSGISFNYLETEYVVDEFNTYIDGDWVIYFAMTRHE